MEEKEKALRTMLCYNEEDVNSLIKLFIDDYNTADEIYDDEEFITERAAEQMREWYTPTYYDIGRIDTDDTYYDESIFD